MDTYSKPIDIIKYPFSGGAALDRSFSAPDIIQSITSDLLTDHINDWKDINLDKNIPSTQAENGLKNLEAVSDAVTKLGSQIIRSLWQGHTPLALGGGHDQAIATIKATALTLLIKSIINNELAVNSQLDIRKLAAFSKKSDAENMAQVIRGAIKNGHIQTSDIEEFIDQIAIIWIDAHADYNDRHSSKSGNIHGMPLAAATRRDIGGIEKLFGGDFIRINPKNCYVLCARDIDDKERTYLDEDGVQYKEWELTHPGAMRTPTDPDNPKTLKTAIDDILERIGDKHIIFSFDIDGLHAGIHKSKYGLESVAATGTPMGLNIVDVQRAFGQAACSITGQPQNLRRLNANNESPSGPSAGDAFEAIQDILKRPNVVAADLSEISAITGHKGTPIAENERGLTLKTSMKLLAAMLGADLPKFATALDTKNDEISAQVRHVIEKEEKS